MDVKLHIQSSVHNVVMHVFSSNLLAVQECYIEIHLKFIFINFIINIMIFSYQINLNFMSDWSTPLYIFFFGDSSFLDSDQFHM